MSVGIGCGCGEILADIRSEHRATFASAEHEGRNPLTNAERMCRDTVVNVENNEKEEVGCGHDLWVERMAE